MGELPATAHGLLAGFAVTSATPSDQTTLAAATLIALLAHEGTNVAAMVPVETGIDEPCEPGSAGALIRWAAAHMDNPRLVTPFALEARRSPLHAADVSGTLLHSAAFDRAREELCDGRSMLVISDAVGLLDPITPSLTMLDLIGRWALPTIIVEPISRWSLGHVSLVNSALMSRKIPVAGVILSPSAPGDETEDAAADAVIETLAATLECPVLRLPHVISIHDRGELLEAAQSCGMSRIARRSFP
jgi:dethiobiotin synthase